MAEAPTRSLCLALGRLRFVVVTACWIIALCLATQVVVWSLCSFTDLRYTGDPAAAVESGADDGKAGSAAPRRWTKETTEEETAAPPTGTMDKIFRVVVIVARTMGLMCALVICPLLSLGLLLAVPAGAPRVERAVDALTWAVVLVLLAMPLGGWFGLAWQHGTITDYQQMVVEVEAAREADFGSAFYSRFLLLPGASAVGFILVGLRFNAAVVAVLMRGAGLDPALEAEASNVAATSLHGTGRTAGALNKALEADRKARKKRQDQQSMTRMSPGEAPKRLI